MAMTRDEKRTAWDFAVGLQAVDGRVPSEDMMEMIEKEIDGEMTVDDIARELKRKYSVMEKKK